MIKKVIKNILPYGFVKKRESTNEIVQPRVSMPEVYNAYGNRMRVYFLKDSTFISSPYSATAGAKPKYLLWDRANYGLNYHFYTDFDLLKENYGKPIKKYAIQIEGESTMSHQYNQILDDPAVVSDYEVLFTHNDKLLQAVPNAKPFVYGGIWYGTEAGGGIVDENAYEKKSRNISMIASWKRLSYFHNLRYELAQKYDKDTRVDCYGSFRNGVSEKVSLSLTDYRYSIVIECEMSSYFITEKVMNCFASMTVPIYIGTPYIKNFFNMDGIILVLPEQIDELDEILNHCCEEDYQERIVAIKDNFNRVQKYNCIEDYLFEEYEDILPIDL